MKAKFMSLSALAVATALIGLSIASDAAALPASGYRIIYFSDETHTTIIGKEVLACNGHYTVTGTMSDYYTETDYNCPQ